MRLFAPTIYATVIDKNYTETILATQLPRAPPLSVRILIVRKDGCERISEHELVWQIHWRAAGWRAAGGWVGRYRLGDSQITIGFHVFPQCNINIFYLHNTTEKRE